VGSRLGPRRSGGRSAHRPGSKRRSLRLAGLTTLWIVLELFIEKEDLLSGSEDKLAAAVNAD
jgi:hypothetical protein